MKSNSHKSLHSSQTGIVSIVVTMIIMIVLTLIVIGFARLSRREQAQSLDRQLNTQAFYAAESAVNDVKFKLEAKAVDMNGDYTHNCTDFIDNVNNVITPKLISKISSSSEYTCLLVDPAPSEIILNPVGQSSSSVFPLRGKNSAVISSVRIEWQPSEGGGHDPAACRTINTTTWAESFPRSWPLDCKVGMLRFNMVKFGAAEFRQSLIDNSFTGFFYPQASGGPQAIVPYSAGSGPPSNAFPSNGGVIRAGSCNDSGHCNITINGINSASSYVRLRSLYRTNNVQIYAFDSSGNPVELIDAQASVDATGRAGGVLRRIQVRVRLESFDDDFPESALQSAEGICKRYAVTPPTTVSIDAINDDDTLACSIN